MPARRFDDWGRHPAAFGMAALEMAVEAARVPLGGTVVDPFVGSGRSATFIAGRGDSVVGIEAHPLMVELANLKLTRPGQAHDLRVAANELAVAVRHRSARARLDQEPEVLRRFLPSEQLLELSAWRDAVNDVGGVWRLHLQWLVLGALRDIAGNSWPYAQSRLSSRASSRCVADLVAARVEAMASDLAAAPREPNGHVVHGDARRDDAWASLAVGSADASVSSPPYLNQLSYAEATRLELFFLGWVSSWKQMTEQVSRHLVTSCTQQVTAPRARDAVAALSAFPGTTAAVGSLARRLKRAQEQRSRPKAYDQLVWAYFGDVMQVLRQLNRALVVGGRAAWVIGDSAPYGVMVDTPALIGLLAEELGFEVLNDVHLRARGTKWPGVGARHSRPLTERMLVFRRPGFGQQQRLPGFTD